MQGTSKEEKNDLLFGNFEINYQKLNPMFRQGSCILKTEVIFQFCSELYIVLILEIKLSTFVSRKFLFQSIGKVELLGFLLP